ncbi:unnamed protein product [Ambrosiozyma monospora]|uniref:Unnamed protein product n=1 Tax=Ambrosiozyma monospora TaxID=43982 RepID=A0ACB5U466_AMBMO|nr:unnamed protein product [Ambrosiozyma monospora]
MEANMPKVQEIMSNWGINADEIMLAMSTGKGHESEEIKKHMEKMKNLSHYQRQLILKERMKMFFDNTDKFPLALTFVMRSMRIVQGLNKNFGSPCNRIGMLVAEANETVKKFNQQLGGDVTLHDKFLTIKRFGIYLTIKLSSFISFQWNRFRKFVFNTVLHLNRRILDLEEEYEQHLINSGKSFGFEEVPTTSQLMA